ncbi:hypothetical protein LWI29_017167 [Acer saccharum]|uniref:Uncharacterized protein n=1 Tax=Acer saccharum TaxID=4024 RepID=A0AA39VTB0_ACESA|nr:hypothetical protein LWI29_017167 [Acer saccharum]
MIYIYQFDDLYNVNNYYDASCGAVRFQTQLKFLMYCRNLFLVQLWTWNNLRIGAVVRDSRGTVMAACAQVLKLGIPHQVPVVLESDSLQAVEFVSSRFECA